MIDSAKIFPTASSLRFVGVTKMVAIVPRSFSPAMASGATDIHPENRKIISSIGSMEEKMEPVASFSLARS